MKPNSNSSSKAKAIMEKNGTTTQYGEKDVVYTQGTTSDAIYFILDGMVMLTVKSNKRRSSTLGMLARGDFFNEHGLHNRLPYLSTAKTIVPSTILSIKKPQMIRLLRKNNGVSTLFESYLLSSIKRFREDLVDAHVNSSKQRLARTLLRLAGMSTAGPRSASIPRISQQTLSEIIGTTRSRTNFFMNGFRKRGYIAYNGATNVKVNSSLRNALPPPPANVRRPK